VGERLVAALLEAGDVHRLRQPRAGDAMIAEEWEVLPLVVQRCFEEGADHEHGELPLLLGRDEPAEIEEPSAAWARVGAPPDGIPLAVVGAIDVPRRFEPRLAVRELDTLPRSQSGER